MNIDDVPAGREMDMLVAEKVMGYTRRDRFDYSIADTAPLAICRAALKRVNVRGPE